MKAKTKKYARCIVTGSISETTSNIMTRHRHATDKNGTTCSLPMKRETVARKTRALLRAKHA